MKRLVCAFVMSVLLSTSAFAGEIGGVGAPAPPPPDPGPAMPIIVQIVIAILSK